MKLLFDYLPLILFFSVFKWAGHSPEAAHAFASEHLSAFVAGGSVSLTQAPILLATVATILATLGQILFLLARRQKIDAMLWVSLAIVTIFGGATIYFNNETFIKWKPTVLYWSLAVSLLFSDYVLKKNLTRVAIDKLFAPPEHVWRRMNNQWAAFFAVLGVLNLWVAFHFSTDDWVNFKLFGATALSFAMFVGQTIPLMKYMKETDAHE